MENINMQERKHSNIEKGNKKQKATEQAANYIKNEEKIDPLRQKTTEEQLSKKLLIKQQENEQPRKADTLNQQSEDEAIYADDATLFFQPNEEQKHTEKTKQLQSSNKTRKLKPNGVRYS